MSDIVIMILEIGAIACYLFGAILAFINKNLCQIISKVLWVVAVLCNAGVVLNNWLVNGYVPFVSMYQVITFLALVFAPIYLFIAFMREGGWMRGYFSIAAAICMTGVLFMSGSGVWHFPPALQSMWFVPHILAYMIGYSLTTVASILAVVSIFKKKDSEDKLKIELGVYNLAVAAFPFMTMGMFFGAIWADAVWGEFWSFDSKENWSFVTWLMITLYLHFRRDEKLKKFAKIFIILGFVGVVITMLFVNFMGGSSNHTYSM